MKEHNPLYQNILIDCNRLEQLPIDSLVDVHENMVNDTHSISPNFFPNQDLPDDFELASFIPTVKRKPKEWYKLSEASKKKDNINCLDIGSTPFNGFSAPYLAPLAFPILFPDGKEIQVIMNKSDKLMKIKQNVLLPD